MRVLVFDKHSADGSVEQLYNDGLADNEAGSARDPSIGKQEEIVCGVWAVVKVLESPEPRARVMHHRNETLTKSCLLLRIAAKVLDDVGDDV